MDNGIYFVILPGAGTEDKERANRSFYFVETGGSGRSVGRTVGHTATSIVSFHSFFILVGLTSILLLSFSHFSAARLNRSATDFAEEIEMCQSVWDEFESFFGGKLPAPRHALFIII